MPDPVRIGEDPAPLPPRRSSKLVLVAVGFILLGVAGAWIAGSFGESAPPTTSIPQVHAYPGSMTTLGTLTTAPAPSLALEARLAAARALWASLGVGNAAGAAAAFPAASPSAIDLMGFVAAFDAGFMVGDCVDFPPNAARCTVTITNNDLLAIGAGSRKEVLVVDAAGKLEVPEVLGSAAARLSLHALQAHAAEARAACPLIGNPQVPGLAIAGSATAECGAYLAGLIPEYLAAQSGTTSQN